MLKVEARRQKAMELRLRGWSYSEIGRELQVSAHRASQYVREICDRNMQHEKETAPRLIHMEVKRLDKMFKGLEDRANSGEPRFVEAALKVMERRSKMLALDAPAKSEIALSVGQMSDAELLARCQVMGIQVPVEVLSVSDPLQLPSPVLDEDRERVGDSRVDSTTTRGEEDAGDSEEGGEEEHHFSTSDVEWQCGCPD